VYPNSSAYSFQRAAPSISGWPLYRLVSLRFYSNWQIANKVFSVQKNQINRQQLAKNKIKYNFTSLIEYNKAIKNSTYYILEIIKYKTKNISRSQDLKRQITK